MKQWSISIKYSTNIFVIKHFGKIYIISLIENIRVIMKIFETPETLFNYIPQCILCGKTMPLLIEGSLTAFNAKRSWGSEERVRVSMDHENGIIQSKHKKYPITIEIHSGKIINGLDIFDRLRSDYTRYIKSCPTCDFKIEFSFSQRPSKENFPYLVLKHEKLHYTLRGGREIEITKSYYDDKNLASIRIGKKFLPPMPGLDFNKFKNITHLNQRLSTLIVFG